MDWSLFAGMILGAIVGFVFGLAANATPEPTHAPGAAYDAMSEPTPEPLHIRQAREVANGVPWWTDDRSK